MHNETLEKLTEAAKKKIKFLNSSKIKYLVSSAFAGMYVGLGIVLIFTIGGYLTEGGSPFTKTMMGLSFAIALSLVIFTGSELFTSSNMIMTAGMLNKEVTILDSIKIWIYSYLGNLIGALILSALFVGTGLVDKGPAMEYFAHTAEIKSSVPIMGLFFRGILCNILVCVSVLCTYKTNSDTSKLILIFYCLFAFITSGYEHSIANMTTFGVALLAPSITTVTLGGAVYNLIVVTLGNFVGGALFLGVGSYILGKSD